MIYNVKKYISKLHSARKTAVGMALVAMLACGLLCVFRSRAAEVYKPLDVEIRFDCLENVHLSDGSYRIGIRAEGTDYPMPDRDRVVVTDGKGSFHIAVTEPGTYSYRVWQEKGTDTDVIYDSAVYEIHLFVENSEKSTVNGPAELICTMSVNYAGTDEKPAAIKFLNEAAHMDQDKNEDTRKDTDKNKASKTNDESNPWIYIIIMAVSLLFVIILFLWRILGGRKEKDEEENTGDENAGDENTGDENTGDDQVK